MNCEIYVIKASSHTGNFGNEAADTEAGRIPDDETPHLSLPCKMQFIPFPDHDLEKYSSCLTCTRNCKSCIKPSIFVTMKTQRQLYMDATFRKYMNKIEKQLGYTVDIHAMAGINNLVSHPSLQRTLLLFKGGGYLPMDGPNYISKFDKSKYGTHKIYTCPECHEIPLTAAHALTCSNLRVKVNLDPDFWNTIPSTIKAYIQHTETIIKMNLPYVGGMAVGFPPIEVTKVLRSKGIAITTTTTKILIHWISELLAISTYLSPHDKTKPSKLRSRHLLIPTLPSMHQDIEDVNTQEVEDTLQQTQLTIHSSDENNVENAYTELDREIEWAIRANDYERHADGSEYEVDMLERLGDFTCSPTTSDKESMNSVSPYSETSDGGFERIDEYGNVVGY